MESKIKTAGTASITIDGKTHELPIYAGSTGPNAVDVRALYAKTGNFTFDPGYTSTASTESQITFIDGQEGVLLYRGYPIEQLAEKSTFLETRVSYHAHGDWQLRILANKEVLHDQLVSFGSVKKQWHEVKIDLTKYAGKDIQLTLENRPNNWAWEFAFWGHVKITHE